MGGDYFGGGLEPVGVGGGVVVNKGEVLTLGKLGTMIASCAKTKV